MTEHDLQNSIRKELTKYGFINFRTNVGKIKIEDGRWFDTGLPKGHSDIAAYKNSRAYFIEVKIKPNKATKEQLNFIEQMKKKGCEAGVAYCVEDALRICGVIF